MNGPHRFRPKLGKRVFIFNIVAVSMLLFPGLSSRAGSNRNVILYDRDGNVFVANIDGSEETQLTSGPTNDIMPSISPDGTTIAFSRAYDLYLMDPNGASQRLLVSSSSVGNNVHDSDWTLDGQWIYFNAVSGCCSGGLYKVRPDGTGVTQVKSGYVSGRISIRDSIGDRVIFNQRRSGLSYSQNVRITDLDGGSEEQVTGGSQSEGTATFGPCWSPDGQRFAYNCGHQHIYVADYPGPYNPVEVKTFGTWQSHSLEWLNNDTLIWIDAYDAGPMHTINVDTLAETDLGINGQNPYVGTEQIHGSHDQCLDAIVVEVNEPCSGSTSYATGTDISTCAHEDTNDVWHSFTARYSADYTISLCGSAFDTTLVVFDGCGGTELACNDDTGPDVCDHKWQSQVTLDLQEGSTYYIRVAGWNGETGDYTLTVFGPQCTEPPEMDFTGDCRVGFGDLAIFLLSWLDCNIEPQDVCWQ
ncbi:MAG: TolB family protein [Planctomycetota bacterium]